MNKMIDLSGKRILVAGATGGIGKSIVKLLSAHGAEVALLGRNEDKIKKLIDDIGCERVTAETINFSSAEQIKAAVQHVSSKKKLDGMVYAVGVHDNTPLRSIESHDLVELMGVNFNTFAILVQNYAKRKNNNGGSIVAISSVMSFIGEAGNTLYSATKGAMDSFIRSAAKELLRQNIRINSIRPAMVDTDMYNEANLIIDGFDKQLKAKQPMGLIPPDQVAAAAVFLLSDSAGFITGSHIDICAGYGI